MDNSGGDRRREGSDQATDAEDEDEGNRGPNHNLVNQRHRHIGLRLTAQLDGREGDAEADGRGRVVVVGVAHAVIIASQTAL